MNLSFWSHCQGLVRRLQNRRLSRPRERWRWGISETLEDRALLSSTPAMVLDINSNTLPSNPSPLVAVGSTTYFTADDGIHGQELWKSDGTTAGTVLVKDINPGSAGSSLASLTNVNGALFFTEGDSTTGYHLWKSNGTDAGTVRLKDFSPDPFWGSGPSQLINVNGTLFFSAYDNTHGVELWKSDGTVAGTTLVKDIAPGIYTPSISNLTNVNGTLFFWSSGELWKSDGTDAGTTFVKGIFNDFGGKVTNVNSTLFFAASSSNGDGLWKSDGTSAGTVLVSSVGGANLTNVNGTLFYTSWTGSEYELWKSNGTAAGTVRVRSSMWNPTNLTNVNGTLFFSTYDDPHGQELWKSDGTSAGTTLVKDIYPGAYVYSYSGIYGSSNPSNLTNVNGTLFFLANTSNGQELWKSDGNDAGTVRVSASVRSPGNPINVNGTLFFTAADGTHGQELWKSDGTAVGTTLVKDINTFGYSSAPYNLTNVNGTLFFMTNAKELWKSDGTAAGTVFVKNFDIYSYAVPYPMTNVNGTLYFSANDGTNTNNRQLWKSDGTTAGTMMVKFIRSGGSSPGALTNVNGTLFFSADDGANGRELWRSDGTVAGTVLVKDINPGSRRFGDRYSGYWYDPDDSYPGSLTNVNGTLFFTAYDNTNGRELWKSDGTVAGTVLVKDIDPRRRKFGDRYSGYGYEPYASDPSALTNVNGTLYFSASDGVNGYELWKSDGTAAGTMLVKDINLGTGSSSPANLTNVNGTLYFVAGDGVHGAELWKSDGTAAGTMMVKDILFGTGSSSPGNLTNVNGTLYFTASDGVNGNELWKSDGTAAGTMMVKDIILGTGSSSPGNLTNVNGTLYFGAFDLIKGYELWMSDGTAAGTALVRDINPGSGHSYVNNLTNANGTLFFTANDGIHGRELWALSAAPTPSLGVTGFPATTTAGSAGSFTITARNADGTTNTGYIGTVHFASSDPQAVLPADYTFTAAEHGVHTFTASLKTAGTHVITATDTQATLISGTQSSIFVKAAAASTMNVGGFPSTATAGVAGGITVTLKDPYGNIASGYTGIVHFTSSDAQATLPANYTFTAADAGTHTFSVTLKTAGTQSIGATDTQVASMSGAQASLLVKAAAASTMTVGGFPSTTTAGVARNVTVTLKDPYGNIATGTVHFTSSDAQAVLPADYTFTPADAGTHTFSVTLKTAGTRSITVTNTLYSAFTATQGGIIVNAAAASRFLITAPSTVKAGVAFSLTMTVQDSYGNVIIGYTGTVRFTSTDGTATLPANYTFKATDQGVHTFSGLILRKKGNQNITTTDTLNSTLTATRIVSVTQTGKPNQGGQ